MVGRSSSDGRRALWRSRWAAIGAAVAVTLGGGGMLVVQAASSPASSVVAIDPLRVLDTRTDLGLAGPFVSLVPQKLNMTGGVVPAGATGVFLNVTAVSPTAAGFVSIRPGDATGAPSISSLNFTEGSVVANAVQVGLPTAGPNAGMIDITYDAYSVPGASTEMLIDVVGYTIPGGGGEPGPRGDTGATGPPVPPDPKAIPARPDPQVPPAPPDPKAIPARPDRKATPAHQPPRTAKPTCGASPGRPTSSMRRRASRLSRTARPRFPSARRCRSPRRTRHA